jgi:hypothetical protein
MDGCGKHRFQDIIYRTVTTDAFRPEVATALHKRGIQSVEHFLFHCPKNLDGIFVICSIDRRKIFRDGPLLKFVESVMPVTS